MQEGRGEENGIVEPLSQVNKPPHNKVLGITTKLFFSLAKVTVNCMEENLKKGSWI